MPSLNNIPQIKCATAVNITTPLITTKSSSYHEHKVSTKLSSFHFDWLFPIKKLFIIHLNGDIQAPEAATSTHFKQIQVPTMVVGKR